jgi:hypothetical protein
MTGMSFHIKEIGWIKWVGSISRRYTAFSCHQGCRTMSQQDRLLALASGTARLKTFRFRWEIIVESFKSSFPQNRLPERQFFIRLIGLE